MYFVVVYNCFVRGLEEDVRRADWLYSTGPCKQSGII